MSDDENQSIQVGVRVSKTLHGKLVDEQQKAKKLTGIEPSISDVVRMLVERGIEANGKRR